MVRIHIRTSYEYKKMTKKKRNNNRINEVTKFRITFKLRISGIKLFSDIVKWIEISFVRRNNKIFIRPVKVQSVKKQKKKKYMYIFMRKHDRFLYIIITRTEARGIILGFGYSNFIVNWGSSSYSSYMDSFNIVSTSISLVTAFLLLLLPFLNRTLSLRKKIKNAIDFHPNRNQPLPHYSKLERLNSEWRRMCSKRQIKFLSLVSYFKWFNEHR